MSIEIIRGSFPLRPNFDRDMRSERRWKVLHDSPEQEGEFIPQLTAITINWSQSSGANLLKWCKGQKRVGGQRHLEAFRREPKLVRREWRNSYILGPSTMWLEPDDGKGIVKFPYIYWFEEICCMEFADFDVDFGSDMKIITLW
ncbi:MAG: hypothetical protein A3F47_00800 [Candidatus Staskawiczbacteria bacterium RIFCSPHIGHO2_12_FULL_38_11]|uniref:Uncharacterized protein n=1 Tax=Candidatus Staskawiczbacteria bacterium RIFCSPHIGHO2_12_FULL_38_11 TaxID=1802209 RepID=A0A1G2I8M5_9BACT|nr:MAG: hypothetical protein A3F47_00800 [Candidatus Staskawiczbacteria bacterium RIFCSPHIGHO2_12_FULL_38_11]